MKSIASLLVALPALAAANPKIDAFDVVWDSPSVNAVGSMPIGNGRAVLNVWVEAATGDLLFYIARPDALSEASRYLKLGGIRISFDPDPWADSAKGGFQQRLELRNGRIRFKGPKADFLLFVDSQEDVVHVVGDLGVPTIVRAEVECWRNAPRSIPKEEQRSAWSFQNAPFELIESADQFRQGEGGAILWFHRNESSYTPKLWENQSLIGLAGLFDPLEHLTFGGRIAGAGMAPTGERVLQSRQPNRKVALQIATAGGQTATVDEWARRVERAARQSNPAAAERRTRDWWQRYWNRSWVFVGNQPQIARGYVLQRFMQAIQAGGPYPVKFNGGFATVEPSAHNMPWNADWRQWGDCHWFQNLRHIYHPMLASGDWEMMEPFWRLYETARPIAEARAQRYHGAKGAYFPETMTISGLYAGGDYGWNRAGLQPKDVQCPWWDDAWNQGPELICLMLDRWDLTRDESFLVKRVLPMAESVLQYFDARFAKTPNGKILLDPTQVVETYWTGVQDDMPCVAGLLAATERLAALPAKLVPKAQREFFAKMRAACPDIPLEEGKLGRELAPARKYDAQASNVENGELYAVWPFRNVCLSRPTLLPEAQNAYRNRLNRLDTGWGYDGNVAALLGMPDEAARILQVKCANSHPAYRWPATWGPNFDWLPDQNHGGNLLNTAQLMLLQGDPLEAGGAIRILPAWPIGWHVDAKLHAPGRTVVEIRASEGRIEFLKVTPSGRAKDIVWPEGWRRPER